jgi:hypothetical protein
MLVHAVCDGYVAASGRGRRTRVPNCLALRGGSCYGQPIANGKDAVGYSNAIPRALKQQSIETTANSRSVARGSMLEYSKTPAPAAIFSRIGVQARCWLFILNGIDIRASPESSKPHSCGLILKRAHREHRIQKRAEKR